MFSKPDDSAVKTEVAVSPEAHPHPNGDVSIEAVVGKWVTLAEDASCAEPDGAVKAEMGIAFPSKRAAPRGELKTIISVVSSAKPRGENRSFLRENLTRSFFCVWRTRSLLLSR